MPVAITLQLMVAFPVDLYAQQPRFGIAVGTGIEVAWWVYDRGSNVEGVANTLGWDRTQQSPIFPVELNAHYRWKRLTFEVGGGFRAFLEDRMRRADDAVGNFSRYAISNGAVTFRYAHAGIGLALIQRQRFDWGPAIKVGTFNISSTHPEEGNFGSRYFWELGVDHTIRFGRFDWTFRPNYQVWTIRPEERQNNNENHRIYSLGLDTRLRFWIR
ncbi:MAG: hypothetical protein AAGB22_14065 [Bacteroidota bacterium]